MVFHQELTEMKVNGIDGSTYCITSSDKKVNKLDQKESDNDYHPSRIELPRPSRCPYLERRTKTKDMKKSKRDFNGYCLLCVCLTRCASKFPFSPSSLASSAFFDNSSSLLERASSISGSIKPSIALRRGDTLSDQNSVRGHS